MFGISIVTTRYLRSIEGSLKVANDKVTLLGQRCENQNHQVDRAYTDLAHAQEEIEALTRANAKLVRQLHAVRDGLSRVPANLQRRVLAKLDEVNEQACAEAGRVE